MLSNDLQTAQTLLAEVVSLEPGYKEATRYLHQAVTSVDVAELQRRLDREIKARQALEAPLKPLTQAVEPKGSISNDTGEVISRQLSPWNPIDYLRLLWWILVVPHQLKRYRKTFGKYAERRVSKWLTSLLTWSPLLIPSLALALMGLSGLENNSMHRFLILSGGLLLAGLLTGWLGDHDNGSAVGVAGVAAFAVAGSVASVVALATAWALGMAGGMVLGVALGVLLGVALGVALGVTGGGSSLGVAGGVVGSVVGVVALSVAGGVVFGVALSVGKALRSSLESADTSSSRLTRSAFGALLLSYSFLVWFSFLGGWQFFS